MRKRQRKKETGEKRYKTGSRNQKIDKNIKGKREREKADKERDRERKRQRKEKTKKINDKEKMRKEKIEKGKYLYERNRE